MKAKETLINAMPDMLFTKFYGKAHFRKTMFGWAITKDGVCLESPTSKFIGFGLSHFQSKFERCFQIDPTDVCVDVGACIGDTTLPMLMKGKLVYAIEPEPRNIFFLKRNTAQFQKKCRILEVACSDKEEWLQFHVHASPTGHSGLPVSGETIEVRAERLDHLFPALKPDYMKIDVQSMDTKVLQGATNLLARTRKLVMETHNWHSIHTYREVHDFLVPFFPHMETHEGVIHAWRDS